MSTTPPRFAVVGKPITHSRSPALHQLFAQEVGVALVYDKLEPEDGMSFADCARAFFAAGGSGLNVTLPYKGEALAFADSASRMARQAGAANTLKAEEDGTVSACNTDGAGLVKDLRARQQAELAGARILILGAGGACAGVLGSLLQAKPGALTIANRTSARAAELRERFIEEATAGGVELQACGLDDAPASDIIINATAAGRGEEGLQLDIAVFSTARLAYDLSYGSTNNAFLDQARAAGVARCSDGLGMLVEQGALSFAYWLGEMPDADAAYAQLRGESDGG